MQKKNKLSDQPTQNEMAELEKLFNLNELNSLEEKAKKLVNKYPKVANLYNILGVVLQKKRKFDEAITNFRKAIDIHPNSHLAYNNLGNILFTKKKFEESINSYKEAIKINPNYAEAYSNLGNAQSELGKFEDAINNQKHAIKLNPEIAQFYSNLGNSLSDACRFQEAVNNHQKALKMNPNFAEAYSDLGISLQGLEKYQEAIINHQKAKKLNPEYKKANYNESFIRFLIGDFKSGWEMYESRLTEDEIPLRYHPKKIWDGKYLDGTLLVWGEQGLGDHIIFASMLTDLAKYAKDIIIEVDLRLENLLKRYFDKANLSNIKIANIKNKLTENFDKHIAIASLGKYLRNSRKSFETTPQQYLITSSDKEKEFKKKFFNNDKFKIGISWKVGNKKQHFRNVNLEKMLPILSNKNCDFINLQFGDFDNDLKYLKSKFGISVRSINEVDNYNSTDDLAALINCLDLVITIQNTTTHLAGALGKKTLLMLPKNARWHWFNDNKKSLWYPSIKIFRQEKIGDWDNVIVDVNKYLKKLINNIS